MLEVNDGEDALSKSLATPASRSARSCRPAEVGHPARSKLPHDLLYRPAVAITRASARAAILSALEANANSSGTQELFEKVNAGGALPGGCSAEVFEDLLRELEHEGLLKGDGTRVWRLRKL